MSSSDSLKATLIAEIEESSKTTSKSKKPRLQEDVKVLCSQREKLISSFALQKAAENGVDPRFIFHNQLYQSIKPQIFYNKSAYPYALHDQFDILVPNANFKDYEDTTDSKQSKDSDDIDFTGREKIQNFIIPKDIFTPFTLRIRFTRPILYQVFCRHPLVLNNQRNTTTRKRNILNKREKEKDRKEKLKALKSNVYKSTWTKSGSGTNSGNRSNKNDFLEDKSKFTPNTPNDFSYNIRDDLGLLVAKCISDETLSSTLLTIAVLLSIWKDEFINYQKYDFLSESTLPMMNILAPLFTPKMTEYEKGTNAIDDYQPGNKQNTHLSTLLSDYVIQPLSNRIRRTDSSVEGKESSHFSMDSARTVSFKESSIQQNRYGTAYNSRTGLSTSDAHIPTLSALSSHRVAYSDAGSTVESLLTEQGTEHGTEQGTEHGTERGTETGSADGEDEDLSEEELLAQALAMSMNRKSGGHDSLLHSHPTHMSIIEETASIQSSTAATIAMSEQSLEATRQGSTQSHASREQTSPLPNTTTTGDNKYQIQLLSTLGLYCQPEMWPIYSRIDICNQVYYDRLPLRHVIIMLLTFLGLSCDDILHIDSVPVQTSFLNLSPTKNDHDSNSYGGSNSNNNNNNTSSHSNEKKKSYDDFEQYNAVSGKSSSSTQAYKNENKYSYENTDKSTTNNNSNGNNIAMGCMNMTPDKTSFYLIEFLLDMLINELKIHSTLQPSTPTTTTMDEKTYTIQMKEWLFHRYFLIWAIAMLLKVLKTELYLVQEQNISLMEVGLWRSLDSFDTETMNPFFSTTTNTATTSTTAQTKVSIDTTTIHSPTSPISPSIISSPNSKISLPQRLLMLLADGCGLNSSIFGEHADSITNSLLTLPTYPMNTTTTTGTNMMGNTSTSASAMSAPVPYTVTISGGISGSNVSNNVLYTVEYYRHELRLLSLDVNVLAILLLYTRKTEVDELVYILLQASLYPSDQSLQSCMTLITQKSLDSTHMEKCLFQLQGLGMSFYYNIFLQLLFSHPLYLKTYWNKNLPKYHVRNKVDVMTIKTHLRTKIMNVLLQRLSNREVQDHSVLIREDNRYIYDGIPYYGELMLLQKIQANYIEECFSAHKVLYQLQFQPKRCHSHITLSDDNKSALFKSWGKSWATVVAHYHTKAGTNVTSGNTSTHHHSYNNPTLHRNIDKIETHGILPNTGIHEWTIRIINCDQGRVFVGVVTAEASVDTYIGGDSHGWGFIGTRSLWHDKKKVAEFGPTFTTDSIVHMKLDSDTGTLWISTVSSASTPKPTTTSWEIIQDRLPSVTLYPAISMHHKDDCVKIYITNKQSNTTSTNSTTTASVSTTTTIRGGSKPLSAGIGVSTGGATMPLSTVEQNHMTLIAYIQNILLHLEQNLTMIETELMTSFNGYMEDDTSSSSSTAAAMDHILSYLSHPFITVIIPSLLASLLRANIHENNHYHYYIFQLLPHLLIITKRISKVYDLLSSTFNTVLSSKRTYDHSIDGYWYCQSTSTNGIYYYTMALKDTNMHKGIQRNSSSSISVHDGDMASASQSQHNESLDNNVDDDDSDDDDDEHHFTQLQVRKLSGSGILSNNTTISVTGAHIGQEFKFFEVCDDGRTYEVDGHISLCGNFLEGTYKSKSSTGSLSCTRASLYTSEKPYAHEKTVLMVQTVVRHTALLCSLLTGKLASSLIAGLTVSQSIDAMITAQQDSTALKKRESDTFDEEDDDDEMDVEDDKVDPTSTTTTTDTYTTNKDDESNYDTWIHSDLLSGGLKESPYFYQVLSTFLWTYIDFSPYINSHPDLQKKIYNKNLHTKMFSTSDILENDITTTTDTVNSGGCPGSLLYEESSHSQILLWWLIQVFPKFKSYLYHLSTCPSSDILDATSALNPTSSLSYHLNYKFIYNDEIQTPEDDPYTTTSSSSSTKKLNDLSVPDHTESVPEMSAEGSTPMYLIRNILKNTDDANLLDNYILQHTGQSSIKRIGGELLAQTRRVILASVIYHSGCERICAHEIYLLTHFMKSYEDRPPTILKELWRGVQRVIDMILKLKQSSDTGNSSGNNNSTLAMICQSFTQRAEFLLSIAPNKLNHTINQYINHIFDGQVNLERTHSYTSINNFMANMSVLHSSTEDTNDTMNLSNNNNTNLTSSIMHSYITDIDKNLHQDCVKQINESIKFLLSIEIKHMHIFYKRMEAISFKAFTRIAGYHSIMLLYHKQDEIIPSLTSPLPALSNVQLQAAVLDYLPSTLYMKKMTPMISSASGPTTSSSSSLTSATRLDERIITRPDFFDDYSGTTSIDGTKSEVDGHYTVGLNGVNTSILNELSNSFELVYEFIAQLISRSTWGSMRTIQSVALSCWGLAVSAEDHLFLNRIGIFRILQTVLEDTRTSAEWIESYVKKLSTLRSPTSISASTGSTPSSQRDKTIRAYLTPSATSSGSSTHTTHNMFPKYVSDILMNRDKKLAHLVIKIVHSLASQVANAIDNQNNGYKLSSTRLQRMPSGPDTLSHSLFEMLYAELFYGVKSQWQAIYQQSMKERQAQTSEPIKTNATTSTATTTKGKSENKFKEYNQERQPLLLKALLMSPENYKTTTTANNNNNNNNNTSNSSSHYTPSAGNGPTTTSSNNTTTPPIDIEYSNQLKSEEYIYRILRLLYSVSTSTICRKSLSSPKWISLLLMTIGIGNINIQRKLFQLLQILLVSMSPITFNAYIPRIGTLKCDIINTELPFDDDDIQAFIEDDILDSSSLQTTNMTSAEVLIQRLLDGCTLNYPLEESSISTNTTSTSDSITNKEEKSLMLEIESSDIQTINFYKRLYHSNSIQWINCECLNTLRKLMEIESWNNIIDKTLQLYMSQYHDISSVTDSTSNQTTTAEASSTKTKTDLKYTDLKKLISVLNILGAYINRIDLGSLVSLRPYHLSESLANKLNHSVNHGYVVNLTLTNVEMICVTKATPSSIDNNTLHTLDSQSKKDNNSSIYSNYSSKTDTWVPITPMTLVRLSVNDVQAEETNMYIEQYISSHTFTSIIQLLSTAFPTIINNMRTRKESTTAVNKKDESNDSKSTDVSNIVAGVTTATNIMTNSSTSMLLPEDMVYLEDEEHEEGEEHDDEDEEDHDMAIDDDDEDHDDEDDDVDDDDDDEDHHDHHPDSHQDNIRRDTTSAPTQTTDQQTEIITMDTTTIYDFGGQDSNIGASLHHSSRHAHDEKEEDDERTEDHDDEDEHDEDDEDEEEDEEREEHEYGYEDEMDRMNRMDDMDEDSFEDHIRSNIDHLLETPTRSSMRAIHRQQQSSSFKDAKERKNTTTTTTTATDDTITTKDKSTKSTTCTENKVTAHDMITNYYHTSLFKSTSILIKKSDFIENLFNHSSTTSGIVQLSDTNEDMEISNQGFPTSSSTNSSNVVLSSSVDTTRFISNLLLIASTHPRSGTLAVLSQIEERWIALWDELCILNYANTSTTTTTSTTSNASGGGLSATSNIMKVSSSSSGDRDRDRDREREREMAARTDAQSLRALMRAQAHEREAERLGRLVQSTSTSSGENSESLSSLYRRNNILGTVARSGLFPHLFATLSTPPPSEIEAMIVQMTEMGLPREWAQASLRRCRYNVEMAINLCFEGSVDMAQLVAEDAEATLAREQQQSATEAVAVPSTRESITRGSARTSSTSGLSVLSQAMRSIQSQLSTGANNATSAVTGSTSTTAPPSQSASTSERASSSRRTRREMAAVSAEYDEQINALIDMGFPPHFCTLALRATDNNVDDALGWMISHGEELVNDALSPSLLDSTPTTTTATVAPTHNDTTSITTMTTVEPSPPPPPPNRFHFNYLPLSIISGMAEIKDDLICNCKPSNGNFPTIGCRGYGINSGKWYYELILHSAGCIQVGWVDTAYQGLAHNGQGVGDDLHSWAYDGWRIHVWHEISIDWGARWAIGDVVGCALDLDNNTMSFTLNGYGEKIGMGVAFTDIKYDGLMYPAVSFNSSETVEFNFGHNPLKHLPEGYQPYATHIESCIVNAQSLLKPMKSSPLLHAYLSIQPMSTYDQNEVTRSCIGPLGISNVLDAALEEKYEETSAAHIKRYFSQDSTRNFDKNIQLPTPHFIGDIPKGNRQKLITQFMDISQDLMILYSRVIIFQILSTLSSLSELSKQKVIDILYMKTGSSNIHLIDHLQIQVPTQKSSHDKDSITNDTSTKDTVDVTIQLDLLLLLVRYNAYTTNRTRLFLHNSRNTHLSLTIRAQENYFLIGGAPFLCQLISGLKSICLQTATLLTLCNSGNTSNSSTNTNTTIVPSSSIFANNNTMKYLKTLFDYLLLDATNSHRREYISDWLSAESGLVPMIHKSNQTNEQYMTSYPSLLLSVWITYVYIECLLLEWAYWNHQLQVTNQIHLSDWHTTVHSLETVCQRWVLMLQSPSTHVKMCALRILAYILQEVYLRCTATFHSHPAVGVSICTRLYQCVPIVRLEKLAKRLINSSRKQIPVIPEYLQVLLELCLSTKQLVSPNTPANNENVMEQTDSSPSPVKDITHVSSQEECAMYGEMNTDCVDYNIDSVYGHLLTEQSHVWMILTGYIQPYEIFDISTSTAAVSSTSQSSMSRRHDLPPTLLPGCYVVRPFIDDDMSLSDTFALDMLDEDSLPPAKKISREDIGDLSSTSDLLSPGTRSNPSEQIGIVTEITQYNETSPPGSGRMIRWLDTNMIEHVRWGAQGKYDVTHIKYNKGTIEYRYSYPLTSPYKVISNDKLECVFGVCLRYRVLPHSTISTSTQPLQHHFAGILELPEFHGTVWVTGAISADGSTYTFTEQKLLTGTTESAWCIRYGVSHYIPGTTYTLKISEYEVPYIDSTDQRAIYLTGVYHQQITRYNQTMIFTGQIKLQSTRLFCFDSSCHASNIEVSMDKLTVAKRSSSSSSSSSSMASSMLSLSSSQVCAFGNIGFSTGVHYWELKIETAESLFVGVAERPGYPGMTKQALMDKCARWMGYGYLSNRAAIRMRVSTVEDCVISYGDHFHSGDIIGVLLDMNRGRLSFFLDGLKYGEHIIEDLGQAFDGLTNADSVKPRVLYPVVGLSKSQDRVTITPRWLSTVGCNAALDYHMIEKSWKLLTHWNIIRPVTSPLPEDEWLYRAAWRDWITWKKQRFLYTRTRFKAYGIHVAIDTNPYAMVEASIRLGLPHVLYRGDRINFSKSSGRTLETKEEAVILGAYKGQIWYRLDSNQSSTTIRDNGSLAWCLTPNDLDGITFITSPEQTITSNTTTTTTSSNTNKTSTDTHEIPYAIRNLELARIPKYKGGLLILTHVGDAVMRNGLEIDNSDKLTTIPTNTVVYALERRVNSSNIARYKILYDGHVGWISERMRGTNEDVMLIRYTTATQAEHDTALETARQEKVRQNISDRLEWEEVSNLKEAIQKWEHKVVTAGYEHILNSWKSQYINDVITPMNSYNQYVSMSTTVDGHRNWTVEEDMQLSEYISKSATREGVDPHNLSIISLTKALLHMDQKNTLPFPHIAIDRLICRASIIRVANRILGRSLMYLNTALPENKWRVQSSGIITDIEVLSTHIPYLSTLPAQSPKTDIKLNIGNNYASVIHDSSSIGHITNNFTWIPPCLARRLRSLRRLLFSQTKHEYLEAVLEATTTPTPLHQDEYEDPREIQTISINRVKAVASKLSTMSNLSERVKQTVFGQLKDSMRKWSDSSYRRAYLGKGHGGQKRAFKVKFLGEGVNDYGGPYRAVFEQVADELQGELTTVDSSNQCILPLLMPCPNKISSVGNNQDKYIFNTMKTVTSSSHTDMMIYLGKLMGMAVRHHLTLGLDLSMIVWRPLVELPLSRIHLESIDKLTVRSLEAITHLGIQLEEENKNDIDSECKYMPSYIPPDWEDLNFTISSVDGTCTPLVPHGEQTPVTLSNWRKYIELVEVYKLKESLPMFRSFYDGLSSVLPTELFPLFTANEIEQLFTGTRKVDLQLLRKCTEYDNVNPNSPHIQYFWEVLEEMDDDELTSLLKFVWARSRMPSSSQRIHMNFKLQGSSSSDAKNNPDNYLPHAQTCFFSLSLPEYSNKDILKAKLLYAINNSPNMDADVRLHSAEGWADS